MYDKHKQVEEEAYKMLRKVVGVGFNPDLINELTRIKADLNKRYAGEYFVEFDPINDPKIAFVVKVTVHTVH